MSKSQSFGAVLCRYVGKILVLAYPRFVAMREDAVKIMRRRTFPAIEYFSLYDFRYSLTNTASRLSNASGGILADY